MDLNKKHILILGGGFGGVRVALDLTKQNLGETKITLVSRDHFHEYHPDLYEVAATFLPESGTKQQKKIRYEQLRGTVAIPLSKLFQNKNVEIVNDSVSGIDLMGKKVKVESGEEIQFDYLVVALGSVTNFFGNKKLEDASLPLKNVSDALNIRDNIDELFLKKKPEETIKIVVGGGGFTGCELAGELVNYLKDLSKLHEHSLEKLEVSIVEAAPNLINGANKWFQEEALKRFNKLGVKVHLNSKIVDVVGQDLVLESGEKVGFDIVIWTAGIKPNPVTSATNNAKLEKNVCYSIDSKGRAVGYDNVFAIGDNCFCFDTIHNHPMPPTAQLAIAQGKSVAENISRIFENKELIDFKPEMPKFIIPIGKNFALTEVYGVRLKGRIAWWLKRAVALEYISSILPLTEALKVWSGGLKFFLKD